jgi:FO synthase subunit 2
MNLDTIFNKALSAEELTKEEALLLLKDDKNLGEEVFSVAREINKKLHGKIVTYVVNRNVNFTNICKIRCKFCGFHKEENQIGAFTLDSEEILHKIRETPGITEVCIQGAINQSLNLSYYMDILRSIKSNYPSLHIHGISPEEVNFIVEISGRSIEEVILALKKAGLDSMAGTAAEVLVEKVRQKIAPFKISTMRWLEIVRTAHKLGLKSTATILFGHIESNEDIIDHLDLLKGIQKETGGFTEFIPLLFIPYHTKLGYEYSLTDIIPWERIKKFYAVVRIYLATTFKNLQTSWVKLGIDRALESLEAGANDFGGTLFEENITRSAGGKFGQYLGEEEIRTRLLRVGKIPLQRDTFYNII